MFLMKRSVFVVRCHVFSIQAYSKFVFMVVAGRFDSAKKKKKTGDREKEREREADIKEGEKRAREREKRDKERQRRAVTSDAVCPHLISACFQPS